MTIRCLLSTVRLKHLHLLVEERNLLLAELGLLLQVSKIASRKTNVLRVGLHGLTRALQVLVNVVKRGVNRTNLGGELLEPVRLGCEVE